MKTCTKCKENKHLSEFNKRSKSKDGLEFRCKTCFSIKAKVYRIKNKDKLNNYQKSYRQNNAEQCKLLIKNWTNNNIDRVIEYRKIYYVTNKQKINNYNNTYRKVNLEKCKLLIRCWQNTNLNICAAYSAKYRAKKLNATIPGYESEISNIYNNCPKGFHVDHIVPLQGENVSGLHVPWNLRVITANENLKKGNKIIDDIIYSKQVSEE